MRGFASLESAVAGHCVIDFGVSWMRLARQKGRRGHDLAPLAIAALDNLPSNQGFWILAPTAVAPIASRHRQWRLARSVRLAALGVKSGLAVQKSAFCTPYRQSGYKAMSSRPRKKIGLCLRPPSRLI